MSALTASGGAFILYFIFYFVVAPQFGDLKHLTGNDIYIVLTLYAVGTVFLTYSAYVFKRVQRAAYGLFGLAIFVTGIVALFIKIMPGDWPVWDKNTAIILSLMTVLTVGVRSLEDIEAGLPEDAPEWWEWFFPK